jgi:hypothetical protein
MKRDCPNQGPRGGRPGGGASNKNGNHGGNWKGKQPYGKLNYTSLEEVITSDKAIIGILQILTHPSKVLFDTGATTSFISKQFIDQYGIRCTKLEYPITFYPRGEKS